MNNVNIRNSIRLRVGKEKMKKTILSTVIAALALCLVLSFFGLTTAAEAAKEKTLTIAYQGGVGYAPIHVMEVQELVQKYYDGDININYIKLDSGAAINEGIIGGTIDVGCMGVAPAISGVSRGIPYKVISNLCAQSHGLMSNDPSIQSLKDITIEDKIALVSTGSFQHILLSMAAENVLGDPHALDNNIQNMSHAEGMASLESGTVKLHLTSSPYIYQERENPNYNELKELNEAWPSGNSFLVAMASIKLEEDEALFSAVRQALADAITFINEDPEGIAAIESEYLGLDLETVKGYLEQPDSQFFGETRGVSTMADFMLRAGFIDEGITMEQFLFDGVSGD